MRRGSPRFLIMGSSNGKGVRWRADRPKIIWDAGAKERLSTHAVDEHGRRCAQIETCIPGERAQQLLQSSWANPKGIGALFIYAVPQLEVIRDQLIAEALKSRWSFPTRYQAAC